MACSKGKKAMVSKGKKVDEVHLLRPPPAWAKELTEKRGCRWLEFVAEKTIHHSDLELQQNRFLIPSRYAKERLVPLLSLSQRGEASFLRPHKKEIKAAPKILLKNGVKKETRKKMEVGRRHGGLAVTVYTRSQWRFFLELTHWDSADSTILKGPEWKHVCLWCSLKEGDKVEIWAFKPDKDLCFILNKKEPTSI